MSWLVLLDSPINSIGQEVLRIGVGALASGATVQVVATQAALRDLESGTLSASAEAYAQALQETPWIAWDEAAWPTLLGACRHIVRAGRSERANQPALCVISDAWLRETDPADLATALRHAGQVVRVPRTPH